MEVAVKVFGVFLLMAFLITVLAIVLAFPFMWAWNAVMPYLFGLKVLTWGKAWCLMFISGMLFKNYSTNNKG